MTAALSADVCIRCKGSSPPPGKFCPFCFRYTALSTDPVDPTEAILTEHAAARAAERLGLTKKAAARLARRAFNLGLRAKDCAGKIHSYLQSLGHSHRTTPIVYGEFVYCFGGARLVTVLPLPHEHRKAARELLAQPRHTPGAQ